MIFIMDALWATLLLTPVLGSRLGSDVGTFWQITDIHYDANYTEQGSSQYMCHQWPPEGSPDSTIQHGEYGDYHCDSPWTLVVSAVNAMKLIDRDPDFLLWTGDSVPHIPDDELNMQKVLVLMRNVTDKLTEVFPQVPIYPVLGNHDAWPAHQVPGREAPYYRQVVAVSGWRELLSVDELETFQQGGYYASTTAEGIRLLVLNSVLWYNMDKLSANQTDPAGHMAWLKQQLSDARRDSSKVYIVGHVPPGMFARADDINWFYPNFNQEFLGVLRDYSDVLKAAIFGHEHTDSFRVVYDHDGSPLVPILLAPAVTPWKSTIPGVGSNNPSLRHYTYSKTTGHILDYTQYFLNLSAANALGYAHWAVEYNATDAYPIPDVTASSLSSLIDKFRDGFTGMFDKYFVYNSVSYDTTSTCTGNCRHKHICAMTDIDYEDYTACVKQHVESGPSGNHVVPNHQLSGEQLHIPAVMMSHYGVNASTWERRQHHHKHHDVPRYMYFVLGGLVVLVTVMFFVIAILCCRRRHVVTYFSQPRYMPIST